MFDEQIEEILRKSSEGQRIRLSSLRHKPKLEEKDIDEEALAKLQKLKKYNLHDSSIPTQKLNSYFCSLCGRINIVTNTLLENQPRRKTDGAISIDLKSNFFKPNLERQKIRYLRRENKVEIQYRWKCECGIPIGYTSINYDEFEQVRKDQNLKGSNRPFFYIYPDSLAEKMKDSKLISQLITYKQTILLHLKRKNKK